MDDNWISDKDIITSLVNLRQLTFEVTDVCNFKCRYCGYGDMYYGHDDRKGDNMPIEIGLQTIDYMEEKCAILTSPFNIYQFLWRGTIIEYKVYQRTCRLY